MSTESISSARPFSPPPALSKLLGGLRNPSTPDANLNANTQKTTPPPPSAAAPARDLVNLSPQARSLQKNDFQQQTDTLSALTRQSLSILTPDADSATISFDQLTYSNASSVSFQQSGSRTQFHSEQQSSLIGTGHITTASGQEFEFTAELDVAQVLDVNQTTTSQSTPSKPQAGDNAADNVVQLPQLPKLSDLLAASSRLLDLLQQADTAKSSPPKTAKQDLAAQISSKPSGLDANLLSLLDALGSNGSNGSNNSSNNTAAAKPENKLNAPINDSPNNKINDKIAA